MGRMQFVLRSWHCQTLLVCYMLNSCWAAFIYLARRELGRIQLKPTQESSLLGFVAGLSIHIKMPPPVGLPLRLSVGGCWLCFFVCCMLCVVCVGLFK